MELSGKTQRNVSQVQDFGEGYELQSKLDRKQGIPMKEIVGQPSSKREGLESILFTRVPRNALIGGPSASLRSLSLMHDVRMSVDPLGLSENSKRRDTEEKLGNC
ncbi:hypothetical protein H8959_007576 [Pygathrix nigripes]